MAGKKRETSLIYLTWQEFISLIDRDPAEKDYSLDTANVLNSALVPAFEISHNLTRIRQYIEEHLLNPDEFFGTYPFPSIAYNDPKYSSSSAGWWGKIWLNQVYPALIALFKYGYGKEAKDAARRILKMLAQNPNGLYEGYNSQTGEGIRCWQFGWGLDGAMLILLEYWQRKVFIFETTKSISGYIQNASGWENPQAFYEVEDKPALPRMEIYSQDNLPLLKSQNIILTLCDPFHNLKVDTIKISLPTLKNYSINEIDEAGKINSLQPASKDGICFRAKIGQQYLFSSSRE